MPTPVYTAIHTAIQTAIHTHVPTPVHTVIHTAFHKHICDCGVSPARQKPTCQEQSECFPQEHLSTHLGKPTRNTPSAPAIPAVLALVVVIVVVLVIVVNSSRLIVVLG